MRGGRVTHGGWAGAGLLAVMCEPHRLNKNRPSDSRPRISYSVFFAAFDMTRRVGLRVKAFFGGDVQNDWSNVVVLNHLERRTGDSKAAPTRARVAQATTIVAGGVAASLAAEVAGRPIRACQKLMQQALAPEFTAWRLHPVIHTLRTRGIRPFFRPDQPQLTSMRAAEKGMMRESVMMRMIKRVRWRIVAVGPWGLGFLVWSYVGGEV